MLVQVTGQVLSALNIETCGDILSRAHDILQAFSPEGAQFLLRVALGISASRLDETEYFSFPVE